MQSQAEFIFHVAFDLIKKTDMHSQGISLIHKYQEGCDLDFDMALYLYEQMNKFLDDPKNSQWADDKFKMSHPEVLTALKRKQELRDKVDVNFDGRVSFLEYLLYQYKDVANPMDFVTRSMGQGDEHPEIRKARLALEEVAKAIREYEAEKSRLEAESQGEGVKALRAKNLLAQLGASPLAETLNTALIQAEAALRAVVKKFGGGDGSMSPRSQEAAGNASGAVYWMQQDLAEKKKYGKSIK